MEKANHVIQTPPITDIINPIGASNAKNKGDEDELDLTWKNWKNITEVICDAKVAVLNAIPH